MKFVHSQSITQINKELTTNPDANWLWDKEEEEKLSIKLPLCSL